VWLIKFCRLCVFCSGKVKCALFGEYVDLLKWLIGEKLDGLWVLIIQFAKVKIFRGMFCIFEVQF